jgi:hypothetical protein
MSIRAALKTGLSVRFEVGEEAFSRHLIAGQHPPEWAEQIRCILSQLANDWAHLDTLTWEDDAPVLARALYPMITSYLLLEEDLIPSAGEQIVLGLLDDAYLLLRALEALDPLETRRTHLALLQQILGAGACNVLDALIDSAMLEAAEEVARLQS